VSTGYGGGLYGGGIYGSGVPWLRRVLPGGLALLEFAFGADLTQLPSTWPFTDVTDDLRNDPGVSITRGRPDQASQAQPATLVFVLDNTGGVYTPRRAMSIHWPYMRRDLPVRFSVSPGTGYVERFSGNVDTIIPGWDQSGKIPIVTISASGLLRRLGQGDEPIRTPLTRSILGNADLGLVRYWPCEDANGADSAASALPGGKSMVMSGTVAMGSVNYAAGTGPFAIVPGVTFGIGLQPQFLSGGSLSANFTAGSSSAWTVQAAVYVDPSTNDAPLVLFSWREGPRTWQVISNGITIDSVTLAVNGVAICTEPHIAISEDMRIDVAQSGGDIAVSFKPTLAHAAQTATISSSTLTGITGISLNPNMSVVTGMFSVGEVRIWDGNAAPTFKTSTSATSAWNAYNREDPVTRLARICAEENISLALTGTSDITMGVQPVDTPLKVLRECETTDGGILSDGINFGLAYISHYARYNRPVALTLDIPSGQVAGPLTPTDDDKDVHNDITYQQGISGQSGSTGTSARAVDQDNVDEHGRSSTTVTVNTLDSSRLLAMAEFDLNVSTVDVERYPQLPIDLVASPELAEDWLAVGEGDRILVTNMPPEASDGDPDTLVEGYTEKITLVDWDVAANVSPNLPWKIFIIGDVRLGRIGSSVSSISGSSPAGATKLLVSTTDGSKWTTTATFPADFPFDLGVNGERMTVTAIGQSVQVVDGTFETGVTGWTPTSGAFVQSTTFAHSGTHSGRFTSSGTPTQAYVRTQIPVSGGASYQLTFWMLSAAGYSNAQPTVDWFDINGLYLSTSNLAGVALVASTWKSFTLTATAPTHAAFGQYGATLGGSPPSGTVFYLDDVDMQAAGSQAFTVTRGIDGVAKETNPGDAVNIWDQFVIGR
jgi:hypothetical protein